MLRVMCTCSSVGIY